MDGVSPLKPTTNYTPLLTNAVPVGLPGSSTTSLSPSMAGSCHVAAAPHSALLSAWHLPRWVAVCLRGPDTCLRPVFASVLQHALQSLLPTSQQPAQCTLCRPAGVGDLLQAQAQLPQNLQLPPTPKMPEWFASRPFLTGTNLFEAAGPETLKQRGTRPSQELGTFSRPVQELVGEAATASVSAWLRMSHAQQHGPCLVTAIPPAEPACRRLHGVGPGCVWDAMFSALTSCS